MPGMKASRLNRPKSLLPPRQQRCIRRRPFLGLRLVLRSYGREVLQGFVALFVPIAVQEVHLAAGGGVEVQLFELQDGPGDAVQGTEAFGDGGLDTVDAGRLVVAEADLLELLHERTLAKTHFAVAPDFIAHEADPFGGIALAGAPQERGFCLFVPIGGQGEPAFLEVVADGFLVVVDESMRGEGLLVGLEQTSAFFFRGVHQDDVVAEAVEQPVRIVLVHDRPVHVVHQDVADERGQDPALGDAHLAQVLVQFAFVDPAELAVDLVHRDSHAAGETRKVGIPESGLPALFQHGLLEVVTVQIGLQDADGSGRLGPVDAVFVDEPVQRFQNAPVMDDVVELLDVAFRHPGRPVRLPEFQDVGDGVIGLGHVQLPRVLVVIVAPTPVGEDFLVEMRVQQIGQILAGQLDEHLGFQVVVYADGPESDQHPVLEVLPFLEDGGRYRFLQGDVPGCDRFPDIRHEPVQCRQVAGVGDAAVPVDGQAERRRGVLQQAGTLVVQVAAVLLAGGDPGTAGREERAKFSIDGVLRPALVVLPDPLDTLLDEDRQDALLRSIVYERSNSGHIKRERSKRTE